MNRIFGFLLLCVASGWSCGTTPSEEIPDKFGFVTLLGDDTLAVENVVLGTEGIRAEVILRSPEVRRGIFELTFSEEELSTMNALWTRKGDTLLQEKFWREGDSLRWERTEGEDLRSGSQLATSGMLPFFDMVHWPFEIMINRFEADTSDYRVFTGNRGFDFRIWRISPDSVIIRHPSRGEMDVVVNRERQLVNLDGSRTTRDLSVSRTSLQNLETLEKAFIEAEKRDNLFGPLSGRGSEEFILGNATVTIDYGTPRKRGRVIWGELVPFGKIWRTGANRATHFTTDTPLLIGDVSLNPGVYTLFSIPGKEELTLIVNRQTGQNGQSYNEELDLGRVKMNYRSLEESVEEFTIDVVEEDTNFLLRFRWDNGEYVVPISVGPGK